METLEAEGVSGGIKELKRSWIWLCLLLAAFLPFVLRLGLDVNAVNRQAMSKVYHVWMLTPEARNLQSLTKEVRFERSREADVFEDLFLGLLQRDFKVSESSGIPIVRAFFDKDKNLTGRIEWHVADLSAAEVHDFEYQARFTNNALLLGFWLSLILMFFSLPVARAALLSLFLMLLWQVRWNPLDIPFHVYSEFKILVDEFRVDASDPRLWVWWGTLGLTLLLFLLRPALRRLVERYEDRSFYLLMGAGFLAEPFLIYMAGRFAQWNSEIYWWKVYAGSLCFRFISVAFVFSLLQHKEKKEEDSSRLLSILPEKLSRQEFIRNVVRKSSRIKWHASIPCLLMPLGFLVAGGWEWLNAVLIVDAGWSILMLKAFLTGFLLALITGSRWISMLMGLFALATVAAPSEGHWVSSAVFGFFLEGLFLGWCLTPMKDWQPLFPLWKHRKSFFVSCFVG